MTEEIVKKTENKPDEADQKSEGVVAEKNDKKEEKGEIAAEKKAESADGEKVAEVKKKKKKIRRQILKGQAHVQCTYNNTLVTFSDMSGKVLAWSSAGSLGFKGAKKATPYAATQIVNAASEKVSKYGLREIDVFVKGVGSGREASIRALVNNDFDLQIIKDITPVPHNGCRPKKPRRV
jgi:small subunit ribosomal protein S11